ncbi:hypothetical protein ACM66B_006554 [Microbotryomycetes sp. NB124-2]
MDDGDLPFEFGVYCIVCDRQVVKPSPSGSSSSSPLASPSLQHGDNKHKAELKRKNSTNSNGVRRNKSTSRLVHSRNRSHGHLAKLQPSTAIHSDSKGKHKEANDTLNNATDADAHATDAADDAQVAQPNSLTGVGSLYCSPECARIDHSRTASQDTVSPLPQVPSLPDYRRNSSFTSLDRSPVVKPSSRPSSSQGMQAFSLPHSSITHDSTVSPMMLDFSHRRNSRGQSYRPLPMQRVPSEDQYHSSSSPHSWHNQRGSYFTSSDSLHRLPDDMRPSRPPLATSPALSSLRSLTPLGGVSSSSGGGSASAHTYGGPRPRPSVPPKAYSDGPRPQAFADPVAGIWRSQQEVAAMVDHEERRARRRERQERRRSQLASPPPPATRSTGWTGASSVPNPALLGLEDLHLSNRSASSSRPPMRTGSSAPLALLGTSHGKAHGSHFPLHASRLAQPQRSDSSVSLSGLVATGTMVAPSEASGSPATLVAAPPRHMTSPKQQRNSLSIPPRLGTSPSSPSSQSSFSHSHSTAQSTMSYLSSSAGSHHGNGHAKQRKPKGLTMTPSATDVTASNLTGHQHAVAGGVKTPTQAAAAQRPTLGTRSAMSTPAPSHRTRPLIHHTAPTPKGEAPSAEAAFVNGPVPPPPLLNPALSYLAPHGGSQQPGQQLSNKQRTFSWDDLGVKTYPVLDVDQIRARKQQQQQQQQQESDNSLVNDGKGAADQNDDGLHRASSDATALLASGTTRQPRKKLFHFAVEDDDQV